MSRICWVVLSVLLELFCSTIPARAEEQKPPDQEEPESEADARLRLRDELKAHYRRAHENVLQQQKKVDDLQVAVQRAERDRERARGALDILEDAAAARNALPEPEDEAIPEPAVPTDAGAPAATLSSATPESNARQEEALARARTAESDATKKLHAARQEFIAARKGLIALEAVEEEAHRKYRQSLRSETYTDELEAAREFRCMTALCWGSRGTEWAVEPVVDLPVGIVWSLGGGALTSYVNANKLNIEFNAGLRFWMWHDRLSVLVYYADPILGSDDHIQVSGSPFQHPTTSVRRPYPSIGIGLFGDVLQIGFAYDTLVNGDRDGDRDPRYRPNQVLSRSLTVTLGFTSVLTARTALAAGAFEQKRAAEEESEKEQEKP